MVALIGAILSGFTCLLMRHPDQRKWRYFFAVVGVAALLFYGWTKWEPLQGYRMETVRFDNQDVHLVGTLYLPEKPGKYPGMVILSASAPTPRSSDRILALPFVRRGFAVLAFDRRGIGESTGSWDAVSPDAPPRDLEPYASDAAAALEFLRKHSEIRPDAVGFIGMSKGGEYAPRAAVLSGHAAYLLTISASPATDYSIASFQMGFDTRPYLLSNGYKDFDPMTSLRALGIPSLWMLAGNDKAMPNDVTISLLDELRKSRKDVEYRVIPGASHGLIDGPAKSTWNAIDPWLARVTGS
ncbi:MAG: prolyl oligopeptidase family serine peptidase [Steroidobacteraceae bacterium]